VEEEDEELERQIAEHRGWFARHSWQGHQVIVCAGCGSDLVTDVPESEAWRVGPIASREHQKGLRLAWKETHPGPPESPSESQS